MDCSFDFDAVLRKNDKKHKSKPEQFVSVAGGVRKRLEKSILKRKSCRLSVFDSLRRLSQCDSPLPEPLSDTHKKVEHRKQQLEIWKQEKEKKKKEAASQKKKPFLVGVVHNPIKYVPPPPRKPVPSSSGRVTRSQTAKANASKNTKSTKSTANPPTHNSQSFAPKNADFKAPQLNIPKLTLTKQKKNNKAINVTFEPVVHNKQKSTKTVPKPEVIKPIQTRSTMRRTYNLSSDSISTTSSSSYESTTIQSQGSSEGETSPFKGFPTEKMQPIVSVNLLTPKNGIPKSESGSEEKLRSPKSPVSEGPLTPEQIAEEARKISPHVTVSRGKDNARKEMQMKRAEGLLDEDASDSDSIEYFHKQLDSEVTRLTHMCDTWDRILEQTVLPESIQELVLSAVGQGRLLMSQKLMQFSSLVQRCAVPDPKQALVTPADLHGFWDMVFMQIVNVDMRFKKLEELRSMDWIEEQPKVEKKKVIKQPLKKISKSAGGASKLREMIAAARKAKQVQQSNSPMALAPVVKEKTFDAGFFSVKSPVRSPAIATPNTKHSLLKSVLSSEAKKASTSKASYAMLRASLLSKNVEIDGIAPLPLTPVRPIDLNATPSRSILKSAKVSTKKKPSKKSIKTVLFDDSETEINNDSITGENIDKLDLNPDSGLSSMDMEKEDKENSRTIPKLVRQDAIEYDSRVMTRSRRKSMNTPKEEPTSRRSSRKMGLQEVNENLKDESQTPKRSTRRRKSAAVVT